MKMKRTKEIVSIGIIIAALGIPAGLSIRTDKERSNPLAKYDQRIKGTWQSSEFGNGQWEMALRPNGYVIALKPSNEESLIQMLRKAIEMADGDRGYYVTDTKDTILIYVNDIRVPIPVTPNPGSPTRDIRVHLDPTNSPSGNKLDGLNYLNNHFFFF